MQCSTSSDLSEPSIDALAINIESSAELRRGGVAVDDFSGKIGFGRRKERISAQIMISEVFAGNTVDEGCRGHHSADGGEVNEVKVIHWWSHYFTSRLGSGFTFFHHCDQKLPQLAALLRFFPKQLQLSDFDD